MFSSQDRNYLREFFARSLACVVLILCMMLMSAEVQALDKVTIQLKWFHQFQFAGYYAAKEKGFYEAEGLDVELRERNPAYSPIEEVLAGRADYGITDNGLVLAAQQGQPVVLVAQIFQHSPLVLLTRSDSGLQTPYDLKGKRITLDKSGVTEPQILAMLKNTLGDLDQLSLLPIPFNLDDLINGKTDALPGYLTDQALTLQQQGIAYNVIDPRDYGVSFYGDNLFTTEDELQENRHRVVAIRRATLKGWIYAMEHPDEIIDIILTKYNTAGKDRDSLRYEAKVTAAMILHKHVPIGSYHQSRYQKIADIYVSIGLSNSRTLNPRFFFMESLAELALTQAEREALQNLQTLRVPLVPHEPPLSFIENGEAQGYFNDLLDMVATKLNIPVERIEASFIDSLDMLQSGQVALLNNYSSSMHRPADIVESQPVLNSPFVVVARENAEPIRTLNALKNTRLVLVRGFHQTQVVQEKFPDLKISLVDNIEQAYSALRTEDADYYIDNAIHAGYYLANYMVSDIRIVGQLSSNEITPLSFHFAVNKQQPLIFSALQKALASIDRSAISSLRSKWLNQEDKSGSLQLTDEEKAWLQANPRIRVAIDPDWAPVEFKGENGKLRGMSADFLAILSERLKVQFIPELNLTWQEVVRAVKEKKLDMFASVAQTPERAAYTTFTAPYVSMPIKIFGHASNAYIGQLQSLQNKHVAVVDDYAIEEWIRTDFPHLDLIPVRTPLHGLRLAEQDISVVFVGNVVTSNYYIQKHGVKNVRILGDTPFQNAQAMAVRSDWPILADILQKALNTITEPERKAIINRWMSVEFQHEIDYQLIWQIVALASLLIAIFVYWNRRLTAEVRQRLRAETDLLEHQTLLEKRVEERANELLSREQRFRQFFWKNSSVMLLIDPDTGDIVEANEAATRYYGYSYEQLTGMLIEDINTLPPDAVAAERQKALQEKRSYFNFRHRLANGEVNDVEVYSTPFVINNRTLLFSIIHDITDRKLASNLSLLRNELSEIVYQGAIHQIMQVALDTAERLTDSEIGFFHFIDADQNQVALQTWSTNTLEHKCHVAEENHAHYPIERAGVWADAVREKRPVIHNDFMALPNRQGTPNGHASLIRELVVPVFQADRITTVIGVGNKPRDYLQKDVDVVSRIAEIAMDFISRKQAEERIEHLAYHDILTGLPNRVLLAERLEHAMDAHKRDNQLLAICFIDLDNFKPINDTYGHDTGDKVLNQLAQRINTQLRDGDTVGRLGGDEFICLFNNLNTVQEAESALQRILTEIDKPLLVGGMSFDISSSAGMTIYPLDDVSPDSLIRHADQAMLEAKSQGKADYCLYDMVEGRKHSAHRKTLSEILTALQNNEFVLYYQPRVNMQTGDVVGVEALIRWQHPKDGLLGPGSFLPFLDGQIEEIQLGEWVIRTALQQFSHWSARGIQLPISINISPMHIQSADFFDNLAAELNKYPAGTAQRIELEVLETAAIGDTQQVSETMKRCKELGIVFSLDDFGTGYSSLTHFHRLPIDILKIDQNFVRNMLDETSNLDIVEGVIRLAVALERPVVAEGVESLELALILMRLGCHYAQGFAIARPLPAQQVAGWIDDWERNPEWKNLVNIAQESGGIGDVSVALFSHERWMTMLDEAIERKDSGPAPELDEQQCAFSRWYAGIGKDKHGQHPAFPLIAPLHKHIHTLAKTLILNTETNDHAENARKLEELNSANEKLMGMVRSLIETV